MPTLGHERQTIPAYDLRAGRQVFSVPYAGGEKFPLTVIDVYPAKRRGYLILEATDATGQRVQVPLGHKTNFVEVNR